MGLQYLTDRPELSYDRGKIFDAIRERRITDEQLRSSDLYYKIADRINMLPLLESIPLPFKPEKLCFRRAFLTFSFDCIYSLARMR